MTMLLANAERLAAEAITAALKPPGKIDYLAWAVRNITFSKRESPSEAGPYNPDRFSYFNEILAALSPSDPCRVVTLAKSAQLGGTVLANVFTGGSLEMDPCDLMYVHPTDNNAERWSKMKLAPMLRGTASLRALFPQKSRDGGDSTLYKERVDGRGAILISGANSPASLSQVTIPRQIQDDLSKWQKNPGGDPESQADSRSRGVAFAKIFKISTPLVMPGCRITKSYEAGSQERCFVPCPHCDAMQTLEWENLLPNLDEDRPEQAYFTCVECGCVIEEHHRKQMLARHEWRASNPKMSRTHRSFYIWSAYSFLQSWRQIAAEWHKARGDPAAEQTFLNDTVGQAYKAMGEAPPWEGLRDRAERSSYARGTVPAGAIVLSRGVDCQGDRVEWQVVGWGRDKRRFVIDYGIVPGHIGEQSTREKLDDVVEQTFPDETGRQVPVELTAIDGNAYTEDVWAFAKRHPVSRVIMVRGRGQDGIPLLKRVNREVSKSGKILRYSRRFYNFATSVLKSALYRNLGKSEPGEFGFIAFPRGLEDEYFRQLTSEHRVQLKGAASASYIWKKIDEKQANEGLDTHLQAEAAAIKLGLRDLAEAGWDRLELQREPPPGEPPTEPRPPSRERGSVKKPTPTPAPATSPPPAAAPVAPVSKPNPRSDWLKPRRNWLS